MAYTLESLYKLIHCFISSKSCAIPDTRNDWLYLTGHSDLSSGSKQVTKYSTEGFQEDLPPLKTGRGEHACSGFHDDEGDFVLLVVGGKEDRDNYLTSTEIFQVGFSSQWKEVSPLPSRLNDARATTVNNNIYLLGWY